MRVSNVEIVPGAAFCQLQAWVESDAAPDADAWFAPFTLWYRFPPRCLPFLSPENADPFLAALLLPAMCAGEKLALPAAISPRLDEALSEIQDMYVCFEARSARIPVEAAVRDGPLPAQVSDPGVGLFFSLGVDSFYSLLKNQRDHPADAATVTHLISMHGFDVPYPEWDEDFPPMLLENVRRVAAETNTTLLPVATNIRRVTNRLAPWFMLHGAALASVALALGGAFRRVTVAATTRYDKLFPWASHPLLDPLWSTEELTFIHDGCELDKAGKTGVVALSPLAMATLRPCAGYGQGYNCGKCLKCLRTMIDLFQAGYLGRCQTLPHAIDAEHLRIALHGRDGAVHAANFRRRLERFEAMGGPPELIDVLTEHLARLDDRQAAPQPKQRLSVGLMRRFCA